MSTVFVAFLLLSLVGLAPFAERTTWELEDTGAGDVLKQLAFLALFVAAFGEALRSHPKKFMSMISPSMVLTVLWCLLSLYWSRVPEIGARRLGLTVLVMLTTFSCIAALGPRNISRLVCITLIWLTAISLLAGPIIPSAVHRFDEADQALVGAWRGVFPHKITAGTVGAILAIMGIFLWRIERRRSWLWCAPAGLAMVYLSVSKAALGMVGPSVALGLFTAFAMRTTRGRTVLALSSACLIAALCCIAVVYGDKISAVLTDPTAFTGRVEIWSTLIELTKERLIYGWGFGSIYAVGLETPLLRFPSSWVLLVSSGHNGFLDLVASLGVIGLGLALIAFVLQPLTINISQGQDSPWLTGMLASIITFCVLQNITESTLLERERVGWVLLLVAVACIQYNAGRVGGTFGLASRSYGANPSRASRSANIR